MAEINEKFTVEINKSLNRLYCTVIGSIVKEDLESIMADIAKAVGDLKPNFSLVNDLTQCKSGQISGIPELQKLMQYLIAQGVRDIVRVVNDKSVIHIQFSNLSKKYQTYAPVYVNSREEADKFLDDQGRRKHLRFLLANKSVEIDFKGQIQQGIFVDLSLGGGAIKCDFNDISAGDELKLSFSLPDEQGKENKFVIKAEVVRVSDDSVAVDFKSLMPAVQGKLKQSLALSITVERTS